MVEIEHGCLQKETSSSERKMHSARWSKLTARCMQIISDDANRTYVGDGLWLDCFCGSSKRSLIMMGLEAEKCSLVLTFRASLLKPLNK